ncbi:MAG: hypothetical protein R2748_20830 [Bryobacterales bacterium]
MAVARRRFTHLALLRAIIAAGYLLLQGLAFASDRQVSGLLWALAVCAYAGGLLYWRNSEKLRRSRLALLGVDLLVMMLLVLRAAGGELAIPFCCSTFSL